ncbi:lymphocyte antigen 6 complex locus protein G6c [Pelodiscus sinensis]|uniref:lymphocyte antigen 6 complex locus protein G6c n=1 Tax=Pelodiscus sinensis TaxID=13735 RepID=UPI0003C4C392|nr:lymphocyte antigen 6 complex locus protein G6c [Pelodiscus sinensis]XP_025040459.1 lymphocyte antigen 6 complex locus protein G6c [Pelodiscus sinensis]|eukprot:XP_006123159.1 lymphocyte antigen 6 complex locus protein G6c [Pelodiscus sinensis]
MKVFFLGLAALLCLAGAHALRCHVCKHKLLLFGCVQGSGEATCGWRERCANIKASLGMLPVYYRLNCTSVANCGKVRAPDESSLTYDYSCCNTDLCN